MWMIHTNSRDVLAEEIYLNKQLNKGLLIEKKIGCFYKFKKKEKESRIFIDVVSKEIELEANELFDLLFVNEVKKQGINVYYYVTSGSELKDIEIEHDQKVLLKYYRDYNSHIQMIFNACVAICILMRVFLLIGIDMFDSVESLGNLGNYLILLTPISPDVIFVGVWFTIRHTTIKKKIEELELKVGDFSEMTMWNFVVVIDRRIEDEQIEKQLYAILGVWRRVNVGKNKTTYMLRTKVPPRESEIMIANTISIRIDEVRVDVPLYVLPIGW